MGLALLPAIVVAREVAVRVRFKALHWDGTSFRTSQLMFLWHKDKWVSPAMAALNWSMPRRRTMKLRI